MDAAVVNDSSAGDGVVVVLIVAGVTVVERALFLGTSVGTLLVPYVPRVPCARAPLWARRWVSLGAGVGATVGPLWPRSPWGDMVTVGSWS